GADFGLAAGWYHFIPAAVRRRLDRGCAGLHASLLPKLRGGAPLSWAILTDQERTGVTLFELADDVDDGPIYGQRGFPIGPRARVAELVASAERASLELVSDCLPAIADGRLTATPQVGEPSYGLQRSPEDGWIDWRWPALEVDRLVRAVGRPYSGALTSLDGAVLHVWDVKPIDILLPGSP